MIDYPKTPDPADWGVLLSIVTGDRSNLPHKLHAAYDLLGYALGQFEADPTPAVVESYDPQKHVEAMSKGGMQVGRIDWLKLIAFILNILKLLPLQPAPQP